MCPHPASAVRTSHDRPEAMENGEADADRIRLARLQSLLRLHVSVITYFPAPGPTRDRPAFSCPASFVSSTPGSSSSFLGS